MSKSPLDALSSEWDAARGVLRYFDDKLYELRKYSFSLIAGLLAVQGLLLPFVPLGPGVSNVIETTSTATPLTHASEITTAIDANGSQTKSEKITDTGPSSSQSTKMTNTTNSGGSPDLTKNGLPYPVKIAILAATLVLIIAVKWLDGNYQGFQRGAAIRAKVIERFQNLELTDEIALRYDAEGGQRQIRILHYLFEAATIILAILLLPMFTDGTIKLGEFPRVETFATLDVLLVVIFGVSALVEGLIYYYWVSPENSKGPLPTEWAIERLECKNGDEVRIMTTNIRKASYRSSGIRHLKSPDKVWDILDENMISIFDEKNHPGRMKATINLMPDQSYIWTWKVQVKESGTYHLCVDMDQEGTELIIKERKTMHPLRLWGEDKKLFDNYTYKPYNAVVPETEHSENKNARNSVQWDNQPGRLLSRKFKVTVNKKESKTILDGTF